MNNYIYKKGPILVVTAEGYGDYRITCHVKVLKDFSEEQIQDEFKRDHASVGNPRPSWEVREAVLDWLIATGYVELIPEVDELCIEEDDFRATR